MHRLLDLAFRFAPVFGSHFALLRSIVGHAQFLPSPRRRSGHSPGLVEASNSILPACSSASAVGRLRWPFEPDEIAASFLARSQDSDPQTVKTIVQCVSPIHYRPPSDTAVGEGK